MKINVQINHLCVCRCMELDYVESVKCALSIIHLKISIHIIMVKILVNVIVPKF